MGVATFNIYEAIFASTGGQTRVVQTCYFEKAAVAQTEEAEPDLISLDMEGLPRPL